MRAPSMLLAGLLIGCGPATPGTNPTGTNTGTTTLPTVTNPTTTEPTQPQGSDYGSLMLVRKANELGEAPEIELVGVFTTSDPNLNNLAQCALVSGACLPQLPTDEDINPLQIDPDREFEWEQYEYGFAGVSVGLGPLRAWYGNGNFPYYRGTYTDEYSIEGFDGTYGVDISGEWGDYEGIDDITIAPMMNVMSHEPGQEMPFHDGQTLVFEWEPQGRGQVYLQMFGGLFAQVWLLEDDGYFELNVDSLNLGTEEIDLKVNLSRWITNTIDINGNELTVTDLSEVAWSGTYFYVGGRDVLVAADTCGETTTMDEYLTGQYWGRLADWGYTDNMNPSYDNGCTGYNVSGEEGFVRFDLPPRTFMSVTHELLDDDSALYIVDDCNDSNSCLVGSDISIGTGPESVQFFNGLDTERTVYAALDGWNTANGLFYADINVTVMGPPDMYDTCTGASQNQPVPMGAGGYFSDATNFTNQLDPATGGCTPTPATGPEMMTRIELQPNETITVNVDMPGGDPSLYLLYTCTNTNSCANGSDQSVGPTEQVGYQNTSGSVETVYLVVDTKSQMLEYFMTIDIQ